MSSLGHEGLKWMIGPYFATQQFRTISKRTLLGYVLFIVN